MNMLDVIKAVKDQLAKVEVKPGEVASTGKSQALANVTLALEIDGNPCGIKIGIYRILSTKEERIEAIKLYGQTVRKTSAPPAKLQGAFKTKSEKGHSISLEAAAAAGNKEAKKELARLAKLEAERAAADDDELNADELD